MAAQRADLVEWGTASLLPQTTLSEELLSLSATRPAPGLWVLRAVGEIDLLTAPRLRSAVEALLAAHPRRIVLDFTHVTFLAACGLHVLADAAAAAQEQSMSRQPMSLRVVAANRAVLRPVQLTELSELLALRATLAEALDDWA